MQSATEVMLAVKVGRANPVRWLIAVICLVWFALGHPSSSFAQNTCSARCPDGSMSDAFDCNSNSVPASACRLRAPARRNGDNDNGAADRARAEATAAAERKRNADASEQQGLDAESRGDLKEAAIRLMEALELEPDSPEIHAHLDRVNAKLADEGDANEIRELRQRIEDSMSAARIRVQRHQMEEMLAKRQERVAIVSPDCIFDGRAGCTDPVALVQVSAGKPPVPADAALFIERIPESVRARPAVKRDIEVYEHMSSVRGVIQNQMIADRAVAKAHPDDQSDKLKLIEDSGHLKAAVADEKEVKKRLSMSIDLILGSPGGEQH